MYKVLAGGCNLEKKCEHRALTAYQVTEVGIVSRY